MEKETHPSNSEVQKKMEGSIISAFKEQLEKPNIELSINKITKGHYSFHFDFHDIKSGIIGEIYSCAFPLKPGHIRKIKSDILKMITYEKLETKPLEKYMILSVSSDYLRDKFKIEVDKQMQGSILRNGDLAILGNSSWLIASFETFKIQVLYYVLTPEQESTLTLTRSNQSKGMNSK